jgi:hypothetical protein
MKRKSPINLDLVDLEAPDPMLGEQDVVGHSFLKHNENETFIKTLTRHELEDFRAIRACTPSPPMSPVKIAETPHPQKSIVRESKRRKLAQYRECREMVDLEQDLSIASDYEVLLFSHMIMENRREPCFRCRLCPQSCNSTFSCRSVGDFENLVPMIERHLFECENCPSWLQHQISRARVVHASQTSSQKPYSHLVWKRVLAHTILSRKPYIKKVKFATQLCQERIIPGRKPFNCN